ncbi:MAG: hypothetical protein R6V49_09420 [Bacteroidales bacterium]
MKKETSSFFLFVSILTVVSAIIPGCKKESVPKVTTLHVVNVTEFSAESGGKVSYRGSGDVIARGVVWGTISTPDVEHNEGMTSDGAGEGFFVSMLDDLQPNTLYYVRAYATNSAGTSYGNQATFFTLKLPVFPSGFIHCNPTDITEIVPVTNLKTGRTWMDRNLGASRAAISSTDSLAFGDLYQWGRFADGHQCRTSATIKAVSPIDRPRHGYFIIGKDDGFDWRKPKNDNLWQGVDGINNPCPSGYRLPTIQEWRDERESWVSDDPDGAFASPLKLPMAGYRSWVDGSVASNGLSGNYRSGSVVLSYSYSLLFSQGIIMTAPTDRAGGLSVRCIKEE